MRRGKMHIFHFLHSMFIPALLGNIRVFFLGHHWLRRHQAPIFIIDGYAAQIVPVRLIQKVHPLLDIFILVGKVVLLNDIVINGI